MTREEIADKFEELARGLREGKTLQSTHDRGVSWFDVDRRFVAETLRIKPEPKYVPFTADDWRDFSDRTIKHAGQGEMRTIRWWCTNGCTLSIAGIPPRNQHITYQELVDEYVFDTTGKPVGKEVKE